MKKSNLNIVKISTTKSLFNYEKKVLIKELILNLKLGYFDFEKEKSQKVKFNLDVNYENKKLVIKITAKAIMPAVIILSAVILKPLVIFFHLF